MIEPDMRKAIYQLHLNGMGKRELSRRLQIDRKTVKKIIKEKGEMPSGKRADTITVDPEQLKTLYQECEGYKQRMYEKLADDEETAIKYSTLTRKVRELGIGEPRDSRCDKVPDEPGAEMQHDTSPYMVKLGGVPTLVIASLIYLRYSKRRYLKFYRRFNRFVMKCFFHTALTFWGYASKICIIDNTNLARLSGIGKNAVIVPEMVVFSKRYSFTFVCHERGHSNRKAGNERGFFTVETNFFPGRTFESLEDLNRQAFEWATDKMYHRELTNAKVIPAKAFEHEQAFLEKLPPYIPEPYLVYKRDTNQYGFVHCDGNFYWVPGKSRFDVKVIEYSDRLKLYRGRTLLIEYPLPAYGVKNQSFSPKGQPQSRFRNRTRKKPTAEEEKRLRAIGTVVGQYLDAVLKPKGIERHNMVRKLFALSRKMTPDLFVKSIERALKYGVTAVEVIERIALLYVHEGDDTFPSVDLDENYLQREAYLEGNLTEEPDLSVYDETTPEEDHG